ncbi:MAG: 2-amino-4-hydroxy-6-hydroxymethyldihydropteridine diphosphokinase [Filomicrobium sp.]
MNTTTKTSTAVVALGSNIGDKVANLDRAVELLTGAATDVRLLERSRNYRTPPWGNTDQDWFINAAMTVETELDPHQLLRRCLEVEEQMGRIRAEKWGPRVIDLDVLLYEDVALSDAELTLPHPQITKRAFVLAPLADLLPQQSIEGKTVTEWLAGIDREGIEPI